MYMPKRYPSMPAIQRCRRKLAFVISFIVIAARIACAADSAAVLAEILEGKGVISPQERTLVIEARADQSAQVLAHLLLQKGLLTPSEAERVFIHDVGATVIPSSQITAAPVPRLQTEAPPPVTSQSKLPVSIYGTILWNSFFNTSGMNNEDVPLLTAKKGTDTFQNFGMTVRQSRLGLRYQGAEIAGAMLSGQVEVDLFGGKAAVPNGISMDLVRLRLAYGRLDWKNLSLEAGQDWSVFAPLNP